MNIPPYILADTNWRATKEIDYELAVLPWGATEAHNYHLPYATDNFQNQYVARQAARQAWERGGKLIVLPNVPFGVNTGQLDVKLCLNMNPSTQYALIRDLTDVLNRQGIHKLVIMNGHGGNHFKQMIRELSAEFPDVFACVVNWYQVADTSLYFNEPGDHAGEMETSCIMHIKPDLVLPLSEAGDGAEKKIKIKGFQEGWASTQRSWTQVTKDTGVGNPSKATAEKAEKYLKDTTEKLADFFVELCQADIKNLYS
ncbi:MAG: creatininase family protein [Cyclobacteriaceae bacterium]